MDSTTLVIGFGAGIIAIVAVVIIFVRRQEALKTRFFGRLGELGAVVSGKERFIEHAGHRVHIEYYQGSKNTPPRFSLAVKVETTASFELKKESKTSQLMEKLGLENDLTTEDAQFDSAFHVDSDDPAFPGAYFASAKKREAVKTLFSEGCSRLCLDEEGLRADWTPFNIEDSADAGFVKRSLSPLVALAEELPIAAPSTTPGSLSRKEFMWMGMIALFVVMGAVLGLPLALGKLAPLDTTKVIRDSLNYSIPSMAAFLFLVVMWVKGRSWFLVAMAQAVPFSLVFFPFAGYWTAVYLNAQLDTSPSSAYAVEITGKDMHRGRNSTSYWVVVRSWRPGHGTERWDITSREYAYIQPGRTTVSLETKPGYLGYEWITSWRLIQPDAVAAARISLEAVDRYGDTELIRAAYRGDNGAVVSLLDAGADLRAEGHHGTPLSAAANQGRMETVKLLLGRGAAPDPDALAAASCNADIEMVGYLLEKGAEVNAPSRRYARTPLMCAAGGPAVANGPVLVGRTADRVDVVKLLLAKGADVEAKLPYGSNIRTALGEARSRHNDAVVALLEGEVSKRTKSRLP